MISKLLFTIVTLLFTSCSVTYVTVNKTIIVIGEENSVDQGGSNLKDNKIDQTADGNLKLPGA